MGSMIWTPDEACYLKAIFSWQDRFDDEQDGGNRVQTATARACVDDLRVLMVGAKGVGKTALLTRFCTGSFDSDVLPDPQRLVRGGRRHIRIDKLTYNMEVLEIPSQYLDGPSVLDEDPNTSTGLDAVAPSLTITPFSMILEQALAITEGAMIVYDICDLTSFQQALRLCENLRKRNNTSSGETVHNVDSIKLKGDDQPRTSKRAVLERKSMRFRAAKRKKVREQEMTGKKEQQVPIRSAFSGSQKTLTRPLALFLVGTKSDADDGERQVTWVDSGKAAAVPLLQRHAGAPFVPPAPSLPRLSPTFFLEASAKTGDNVNAVFEQVAREILRQRDERKRSKEEKEFAHISGTASASSNTVSNRSLLRTKSQKASMTTATRRAFSALRVFGLSSVRRQVMKDSLMVS